MYKMVLLYFEGGAEKGRIVSSGGWGVYFASDLTMPYTCSRIQKHTRGFCSPGRRCQLSPTAGRAPAAGLHQLVAQRGCWIIRALAESWVFEACPAFNTTCDLFLVTPCVVAVVCEVSYSCLFFQNNTIQSRKSFLTAVSKSYIPSLWLGCIFCPSGCKSTYQGEQAGEKLNSPSAYQESLE